MNLGRGFSLHPLAARDITDIWAYIADDSPQAARASEASYLMQFAHWCLFQIRATSARTSHPVLCASSPFAKT
jgi:plasmid stabilization system protein ParE